MLSLRKLKAIEEPVVQQVLTLDLEDMPILDAVNDDEEIIIEDEPVVLDPDFKRLNGIWQTFFKERGETHYDQMIKQWKTVLSN